jgi:hypothetical protein
MMLLVNLPIGAVVACWKDWDVVKQKREKEARVEVNK